MGLHVGKRGSAIWPEKLHTHAKHFEAFRGKEKPKERQTLSSTYTHGSAVLLTLCGCHTSPGLLGKCPHTTQVVCKALLGFSWCCIDVRWHRSKFLHITQLRNMPEDKVSACVQTRKCAPS